MTAGDRALDVAFVAWERIPTENAGFRELAPELALEAFSALEGGDAHTGFSMPLARLAQWYVDG